MSQLHRAQRRQLNLFLLETVHRWMHGFNPAQRFQSEVPTKTTVLTSSSGMTNLPFGLLLDHWLNLLEGGNSAVVVRVTNKEVQVFVLL